MPKERLTLVTPKGFDVANPAHFSTLTGLLELFEYGKDWEVESVDATRNRLYVTRKTPTTTRAVYSAGDLLICKTGASFKARKPKRVRALLEVVSRNFPGTCWEMQSYDRQMHIATIVCTEPPAGAANESL